MEKQNTDASHRTEAITAFDSLFTTNHIQMLKILLFRLSPEAQGSFALYIKFLELQYTFSFLQKHPSIPPAGVGRPLSGNLFQGDNSDTIELLNELLPFSGPAERGKIEGMKNMLQNMSKFQEMMEMMQMMQEMFPEGMDADNFSSMFSGMSGADMSSVFEMLGGANAPRSGE